MVFTNFLLERVGFSKLVLERVGCFGDKCVLEWVAISLKEFVSKRAFLQIFGATRQFFEHTCAYARWAHRHRFASVCLSVCPSVCDWTKIQTR